MRLLRFIAKTQGVIQEVMKPENIILCLGNNYKHIKWKKYEFNVYTPDSNGVVPPEFLESIKEEGLYEPYILSDSTSSNEVKKLEKDITEANSKIKPKLSTYKDFEKKLLDIDKGPVINKARNPLNAVICYGDRNYDSIFELLPYSFFQGYSEEAQKHIDEYKFSKPYILSTDLNNADAKKLAETFGVRLLTPEQFFQLEKVQPRVIKAYAESVEDGCRSFGLSSKSVEDNEKSNKKLVLKFEDEDNKKTYKFELPTKGSDVGSVKIYKESKSLGIFTVTTKIGEIDFMDNNGKILIYPDKIGSHIARFLDAK